MKICISKRKKAYLFYTFPDSKTGWVVAWQQFSDLQYFLVSENLWALLSKYESSHWDIIFKTLAECLQSAWKTVEHLWWVSSHWRLRSGSMFLGTELISNIGVLAVFEAPGSSVFFGIGLHISLFRIWKQTNHKNNNQKQLQVLFTLKILRPYMNALILNWNLMHIRNIFLPILHLTSYIAFFLWVIHSNLEMVHQKSYKDRLIFFLV